MLAQLSPELRQHIAQNAEGPLRFMDPSTDRVYVLVDAGEYDRVISSTFDIRTSYAAQNDALSGVWNDPALDEYATYDLHQPTS